MGRDDGHREPERPPHRVLRRDRATDDGWIRAWLEEAPFGVLATVADGRPFLNPNLFVYDPAAHAIYLHTARVGRTRSNVEEGGDAAADPREAARARERGGADGAPATFAAASMGRLLPADTALEFSVEYTSAICFGRMRVVEDDGEAERALQMLLDKYAPHLRPGEDYRPITPEELRRTTVYRLDVEAWSGKQKAAEPAFPGAFERPPPPVPFRAGRPGDEDAAP